MFSRNFWGISKLRETNFTKFWEWIYDIRCIQIKVSAWVCILGVAREREPRCFLLLLSKLSTQSLETLGIYIYLSIIWCKKKLYNSAGIFYTHPSKISWNQFHKILKLTKKFKEMQIFFLHQTIPSLIFQMFHQVLHEKVYDKCDYNAVTC